MVKSPLPVLANDTISGGALGQWWSEESDGRILCQLCPRACRLKPGDRGFCFVRLNRDGKMVLETYGRSSGFCIDPIEKKPLNHFLPGTPVLSFGTAGCNLGCKFCQNWDISKSREVSRVSEIAAPFDIAQEALRWGCRSVAFTYNDPVIWAEYAIDTAKACHEIGIRTVAVTAGYLTDIARQDFFSRMDAANIDLKAFTENFYYKLTGAHLSPVLDTIRHAVRETDCWVELTNLIIPDANDNPDELKRMIGWILDEVGCDVPVHFTAFHPDFRMRDVPATSHETLAMAYDMARQAGLNFVYVGNVHDVPRQSTYCPSCRKRVIERDWHQIGVYDLQEDRCRHCNYRLPGLFEASPGDWGRRRQPISIGSSHSVSKNEHIAPQITSTTQTGPNMDIDNQIPVLGSDQLESIHRAACHLVAAAVQNRSADVTQELGPLADQLVAGIFVTLKRGNTLRGCCGMLGRPTRLSEALADSATQTALHDPRMAPVTAIELPHLTLSISILGSPRPIGVNGDDQIRAIEVGKHGLRIRQNNHAGLLLPVVAKERAWNARQFLDAVCSKAGLPPGSWRREDTDVEIFDGIDHTAPFHSIPGSTDHEPPVVDKETLRQLCRWIQSNLDAMQAGATPLYYATNVDDMTVAGVALQISTDHEISTDHDQQTGWMHLNVKEGIPMQSSLFQLTQSAASNLKQSNGAGQGKVTLAVLSHLIHHGMDTEFDVQEVQPSSRAMLAMDRKRWSIAFNTSLSVDNLVTNTLAAENFRAGGTMIYSANCDCTETDFAISAGPSALRHAPERPPAVAGSFYPAKDSDREHLVDQILSDLENQQETAVIPVPVNAAMVPHAGLQYSGRVAADVWRRIELPEDILIIGPKHTADGVDWAVAPHKQWKMSESSIMKGNQELARQIAESVPGMELDATAHRQEHGIEVQLPLLYRLAPESQITAIAMSGGTVPELRAAAQSLAELLTKLVTPPMIVISSDMNHFADDTENRRRDELALDKLAALNPEGLLEICETENISMCGQIPAALVLLTLQYMKRECHYRKISYTTSADVSGDFSRVVGYAGLLF